MQTDLRLTGGDQLASALLGLSSRLSLSVVNAALREGGEPMRASAAEHAPRAPGAPDIADNVVMSPVRQTEKHGTGVAIGPSKDFFYGTFQEFGTAHHGANPFMRPAFDGTSRQVVGLVGSALWRALIARGFAGGRGSGGGVGL
jgi:HK97 gp10 family phage protein